VTFFNKKEDVLKIELTPYGRKLLSMGKLKPHSYAFFDDDVLYDSRYGGADETSTSAKQRILNDTPSMKPQNNYSGIDSKLANDSPEIWNKVKYMQQPIGTNNHLEKKSSGWESTFLLGEIDSTSAVLSSSSEALLQIPQIECAINYTMSVRNSADLSSLEETGEFSSRMPTIVKSDGSYVDIEKEEILMNIFERNGFFHKDSYEIEVYLFESGDSNTLEKKLKFLPHAPQVENDMLIHDEPTDLREGTIKRPEDYVENYISLYVDKEISDEDLCRGTKSLQAKELFLDLEVVCPDRDDLEINFYGSRAKPEEC